MILGLIQDTYKDIDKDKYKKAIYAGERPSIPVRPNTWSSLRNLSPPTTLQEQMAGHEGHSQLKAICKITTDTSLPDTLNDFYTGFDMQNTIPLSSVTGFHCDQRPSSCSSSSSSLLPI